MFYWAPIMKISYLRCCSKSSINFLCFVYKHVDLQEPKNGFKLD